eukprot:8961645-Pyramimonas_sp.AAC.1
MLKLLPWACVRRVRDFFQRLASREHLTPQCWRNFLVTLIPECPKMTELKDTRKICLIPLMSKWYSLCLTILAEEELTKLRPHACLFGFAACRKPHEMTAVLKRLSQRACLWGKGESLYLGGADVLQCFDHVTLTLACNSL